MAFEKFFELPDDNFGKGYCIQEYNNKWYIQEATKPTNGDGTVYKTWMSKYKKKGQFICKEDGTPYVFPLGVEIPKHVAEHILGLINKGEDDDSVPF